MAAAMRMGKAISTQTMTQAFSPGAAAPPIQSSL